MVARVPSVYTYMASFFHGTTYMNDEYIAMYVTGFIVTYQMKRQSDWCNPAFCFQAWQGRFYRNFGAAKS